MVYVAAEGEKTERDYVALPNTTYGAREKFFLKFSGTNKGLRPMEVIDLVLESASDPEDEKWALFDRDTLDNRDEDIPEAMRNAARNGAQVALSRTGRSRPRARAVPSASPRARRRVPRTSPADAAGRRRARAPVRRAGTTAVAGCGEVTQHRAGPARRPFTG
ncbi:hypothetical protein GCM10027162_26270 [Streptomyces incanus]